MTSPAIDALDVRISVIDRDRAGAQSFSIRRAAAVGKVRPRYRWIYDQMTKGKVLRVEAGVHS
jgi:hypothetical protein